MVHKNFQDLKLSALGMGAMRLPVIAGKDSVINEEASTKMVDYAYAHGINYYDTAWGYHGGNSEVVMGRLLNRYPRHSFCLASKFPGYDLSNMCKVEEIFERQLKKCGVDYFDFYMFHNVCEMNIDAYLDGQYGIFSYLKKQKDAGRIKHLGFSAHGSCGIMKRFLEVYGEYMEFCQIQLNYLDWSFQNAKGKVELLNELNIPVWVMEPMRGGRLVSISNENTVRLKELRPDEDVSAWAFRFLQTIPGVAVTLTGASNFGQLRNNIAAFETEKPLNEQELDTLLEVADNMVKGIALPCTACRYCVDHCAQQLDIPALLELYNEHCFTGGGFLAPMALMAMPEDKHPGACVGCGNCEKVCPQNIKISEAMADFMTKLRR